MWKKNNPKNFYNDTSVPNFQYYWVFLVWKVSLTMMKNNLLDLVFFWSTTPVHYLNIKKMKEARDMVFQSFCLYSCLSKQPSTELEKWNGSNLPCHEGLKAVDLRTWPQTSAGGWRWVMFCRWKKKNGVENTKVSAPGLQLLVMWPHLPGTPSPNLRSFVLKMETFFFCGPLWLWKN